MTKPKSNLLINCVYDTIAPITANKPNKKTAKNEAPSKRIKNEKHSSSAGNGSSIVAGGPQSSETWRNGVQKRKPSPHEAKKKKKMMMIGVKKMKRRHDSVATQSLSPLLDNKPKELSDVELDEAELDEVDVQSDEGNHIQSCDQRICRSSVLIRSSSKNQTIKEKQLPSLDDLEPVMHPFLLKHVKHTFELEALTKVQAMTIPAILEGRDVLVKSRTGTGKTLAYCLPLVQILQSIQPPVTRVSGPLAIILLPTRELTLQTQDVLQRLLKPFVRIIPAGFIGGMNRKHEKDRIRKGINVVLGTPGRIEDHVQNTASLDMSKVQFIILDEADRMLDMGFKKSMDVILQAVNKRAQSKCQIVLLSATLSSGVHWLSSLLMTNPQFIDADVIETENSDDSRDRNDQDALKNVSLPSQLTHYYVIAEYKYRLATLAAFILRRFQRSKHRKLIVFFATNDSVTFHHEILDSVINPSSNEDYDVDVQLAKGNTNNRRPILFTKLHGSMSLEERKKTFATFISEQSAVLLCTDVAARGLDFRNVTWIIQYNGPQTLVDYVHRSGRTARLFDSGRVVIFLDPVESLYVDRLKELGISPRQVQASLIFKALDSRISQQRRKNTRKRSLAANASSALGSNGGHNILRDIQSKLEETVDKSESLKTVARAAFISFVRSYATFGRDLKSIFHIKNLHLGHVAKSFGLRETPTQILNATGLPDESINNRPRYRYHDNGNNHDNNERKGFAQFNPMSEFDSGL